MTLYTFLGKKGYFYKFNANCSKDVKQGEGPGSCGGKNDENILVEDIKHFGTKYFIFTRSKNELNNKLYGKHSVDIQGNNVYSKEFSDLKSAKKFRDSIATQSNESAGKKATPSLKKISVLSDIKNIQTNLFNNITPKLEQIMNEGDATCPGAAYILAKALQSNGVKAKIVGGEFDTGGHYWVEVPTKDGTYIADIGNNLLEKTLETGKIENIFTKTDSELGKMYENRDEEYNDPERFRKEHNDPFSKRSFDIVRKS